MPRGLLRSLEQGLPTPSGLYMYLFSLAEFFLRILGRCVHGSPSYTTSAMLLPPDIIRPTHATFTNRVSTTSGGGGPSGASDPTDIGSLAEEGTSHLRPPPPAITAVGDRSVPLVPRKKPQVTLKIYLPSLLPFPPFLSSLPSSLFFQSYFSFTILFFRANPSVCTHSKMRVMLPPSPTQLGTTQISVPPPPIL